MNQIRLEIVIDRSNPKQRLIQYFRHGHGDDMVEAAADHFEIMLENAMQEMIEKSGGDSGWSKAPAAVLATEFTILINGVPVVVIPREDISYNEVVLLSGKPLTLWTITWSHAATNATGRLLPGQSSPLLDGMAFDVRY